MLVAGKNSEPATDENLLAPTNVRQGRYAVWAIIVGIACTITTCVVNWYYRRKEREDRLNGYDTKTEE